MESIISLFFTDFFVSSSHLKLRKPPTNNYNESIFINLRDFKMDFYNLFPMIEVYYFSQSIPASSLYE